LIQRIFSVLAAPSRPQGPLKVSDVTKNGCKLKWDKPEDDGGKPVSGYVVEKLDTATGRWVPVGRTTEPEMDVKGLQEGSDYKFRVKAVNDEGESEPLETERATLAKNPFGELQNCAYMLTAQMTVKLAGYKVIKSAYMVLLRVLLI
jgi:predicted phage tail protein